MCSSIQIYAYADSIRGNLTNASHKSVYTIQKTDNACGRHTRMPGDQCFCSCPSHCRSCLPTMLLLLSMSCPAASLHDSIMLMQRPFRHRCCTARIRIASVPERDHRTDSARTMEKHRAYFCHATAAAAAAATATHAVGSLPLPLYQYQYIISAA